MLNFQHFSTHLLMTADWWEGVNKNKTITVRLFQVEQITFVIVQLILTVCLLSLVTFCSTPAIMTLTRPFLVIISFILVQLANTMAIAVISTSIQKTFGRLTILSLQSNFILSDTCHTNEFLAFRFLSICS